MRLMIGRITLLAIALLPVSAVSAVATSTTASAASCNTVAYFSQWYLNCPVGYGNASNLVVEVQREINASPTACWAGTVDGVFGRNTLSAVRCYQRYRGLKQDGVVGPKTWYALEADTLYAGPYTQGNWLYLNSFQQYFVRVWTPSNKSYVVGVDGRYVQMNTSGPN